jgi:adhesin/invasin
VADGESETTATVTVTDADGEPFIGAPVEIRRDGTSVGTVTDHGDGTYTATVKASTTAGRSTITATAGELTDSQELEQLPDVPATATLTLADGSLVADGTSTTKATAIVEDAHGNRIAGEDVGITGALPIGGVTDKGNGVYEATVTSTTSGARHVLTATAGGVSGRAVLRQHAPCVTSQRPTFSEQPVTQCYTVPAGVDELVVTAVGGRGSGGGQAGRVTGTLPVTPGERLAIEVGGDANGRDGGYNGGGSGGRTLDADNFGHGGGGASEIRRCFVETCGGEARVVVAGGSGGRGGSDGGSSAAGGAAGEAGDHAPGCGHGDGGCRGLPGTADGPGGTHGDPDFPGAGAPGSGATGGQGGSYLELNGGGGGGGAGGGWFGGGGGTAGGAGGGGGGGGSSHGPDGFTTGLAAADAAPRVAILHQGGEPTTIEITPDKPSVAADGLGDTLPVTVRVADADGLVVFGQDVQITASGGQSVSGVTDNGDGTYSAEITPTTDLGEFTVTATLGDLFDDATFTQRPGAPASIDLKLRPSSLPADGVSKTTATATLYDAAGHPVPGETVTFESDADQTVGDATDNGDGTYTAEITATDSRGDTTIAARSGQAVGYATLHHSPTCETGTEATFGAIDEEQCFRVPAGTRKALVEAVGAPGYGGGNGARVRGVVPVTPGDRLAVLVGGPGGDRAGGFNGGGPGGVGQYESAGAGGGGGASDVRTCSPADCSPETDDRRLLVAAGGGGRGATHGPSHAPGGAAGAPGAFARDDACNGDFPCGGLPGEALAGGLGGLAPFPGFAGSRGYGGAGGGDGGDYQMTGGGGGGGGLYGGGGGGGSSFATNSVGGGGGGGSSLAPLGGTVAPATTETPSVTVRLQETPADDIAITLGGAAARGPTARRR